MEICKQQSYPKGNGDMQAVKRTTLGQSIGIDETNLFQLKLVL